LVPELPERTGHRVYGLGLLMKDACGQRQYPFAIVAGDADRAVNKLTPNPDRTGVRE